MKAAVQERYGFPTDLEIRDIDRPVPGDDEVLVRVCAASVHPDVWHFLCGRPYILRLIGAGLFKPKYRIPGTDMAGIVESVGKCVTQFQRGQEVFGETTVTATGWTTGGAYAEYVAVRHNQLALKPDNITFAQAAAVPTSGFIALQNLRGASRQLPGKKVLVNGAGGGVGSLALQIAKAYGAHVTAVDSTNKLDMLRALGADEVVDYTREDFTTRDENYHFIFDVPGNHSFKACKRVLEPDGRYVLIGHEGFGASGTHALGIFPQFFKLVLLARFVKQLRGPDIPLLTRHEAMALLRELLEAGKITPMIDSVYPLHQAREALRRMIEGEPRGKVIITLGDTTANPAIPP